MYYTFILLLPVHRTLYVVTQAYTTYTHITSNIHIQDEVRITLARQSIDYMSVALTTETIRFSYNTFKTCNCFTSWLHVKLHLSIDAKIEINIVVL